MKTVEEKAKAYDEAIKVIKGNLDALNEITETGVEIINIQAIKNCFYRAFPELKDKESEDDRIRKELLAFIKKRDRSGCDYDYDKWIAWLEKQSEEARNIALRTEYEKGRADAIAEVSKMSKEVDSQIWQIAYNSAKTWEQSFAILQATQTAYNKGKEDALKEQKPVMIQWTGDNLKELVRFTGKSPKFEEWFKTWEDFENYVHTHNNIFKIFNEDGSHIEIPVGAWIVKTPDGYNVASRYVFKQKPADKVNPKFKVGDWVVDTITKEVEQVIELAGYEYICSGHLIVFFNNQHLLRLWTINDAKDGDVLSNGKMIVIFKHFEEPSYRQQIVAYIGLDTSGNIQITDDTWTLGIDKIKPATKEQRDTLMKAMANAGYTFDFDKKELKGIGQKPESITDEWIEDYWQHKKVNNPYSYDKGEEIQFDHQGFVRFCKKYCKKPTTWSEEDEKLYKKVETAIDSYYAPFSRDAEEMSEWLKALKDKVLPQNTWKPSDELIQALERSADYLHDYGKNDDDLLLLRLLEELKKLKEE